MRAAAPRRGRMSKVSHKLHGIVCTPTCRIPHLDHTYPLWDGSSSQERSGMSLGQREPHLDKNNHEGGFLTHNPEGDSLGPGFRPADSRGRLPPHQALITRGGLPWPSAS